MIYLELTHYDNSRVKTEFYVKNIDTGIGNMLFQIASTVAYGKKYNSEVYVIGLNTFLRLEALIKENTIFRNINKIENICIDTSIKKGFENPKKLIYEIPYINKMTILSHFENYNNFDKERELILSLFSPNEKDKSYLYNKYGFKKEDTNLASLHIRCGTIYRRNYNITANNILSNELTKSYYKGLDKMLEVNSNINTIIVCSDDMNYSKDILNIDKYKNIKFIYSSERDYMDVWLISLIKNNIVSFSTLSWWGSYLNANDDKCIVCCKEFREDLHMSGWIIV
jgi:hypothetical protein